MNHHFQCFFRDHYFTSVGWQNPDVVSIIWTNRLQNFSIVSLCQAPNFQCKEVSHNFVAGQKSTLKPTHFSKNLLQFKFLAIYLYKNVNTYDEQYRKPSLQHS
jgi:hypothetical protein